ncbi:MAG: SWIB/MDM2 domain-containing protein [Alphaproteobacteria bacterium]|jgi:chromatin remodeling complex protein RSC6|nr:SWIB/MDM2 domain-containing protein [Alphaproteobacteria bacterium]
MQSENTNHVEEQNYVEEEPNLISQQFEGLLTSLSTFRSQITALQQQLRVLEKTVSKEVKQAKKIAAKHKNRGNRKPSGFARPTKISSELCGFMGKEIGAEVARTEVTQYVIKYIADKGLQNPNNRKIIIPDESLTKLLGINDEDEVTYFNLQKFMNKHFHSKTNSIVEEC